MKVTLFDSSGTEVTSLGGGGSGDASAAKQDTGNTSLSSIDTKLTSQATAANQTAHSTLYGAVTETAPVSDTASSGLNGRLQRIAQRLTSLIALVPASLGGKTAANSFAVTTATDDPVIALNGAVNETAPVSDTASSGQNGRLQRIAQRLTSIIALFPTLAVEDAAHVSGDSGTMALAVRRDADTTLSDASGDYTPLQVDSSGSLKTVVKNTVVPVGGVTAADAAVSENPEYMGARASAAAPTSMSTDGDKVGLWATLKGALNIRIVDVNAVDALGEVQASPTSNTVLDRLKALKTSVDSIIGSVLTYSAAQTVTITLTSLANSAWRQSAVVDNTSNLYVDALIGGSIQVGTSPTTQTTINIYAYGTFDGTNYTGGASGSDAAYTADGEETRFKLLESIVVDNTSDQDYVWGPTSVCAQANWPVLPSKWGIVVSNATAVALNATGTNNICKFTGVK